MIRDRRYVLGGAALVILAVMMVSEPTQAQCMMCRTALQSPEARQLAEAFRSGILFLLAVPFVAFGAVTYLAVRSKRRLDAQRRV